jgi:hypothetical protein
MYGYKSIFLSSNLNHYSVSVSSLVLVVLEGLGFVVLGFILLYFSFFQRDFVFYALIAIAFMSIVIGLHILFAFAIYIFRFRR